MSRWTGPSPPERTAKQTGFWQDLRGLKNHSVGVRILDPHGHPLLMAELWPSLWTKSQARVPQSWGEKHNPHTSLCPQALTSERPVDWGRKTWGAVASFRPPSIPWLFPLPDSSV